MTSEEENHPTQNESIEEEQVFLNEHQIDTGEDEEESGEVSPLKIALATTAVVAILVFLGWLYSPIFLSCAGNLRVQTATMVAATSTRHPTRTPTVTVTSSPTPMPTNTPYPPSSFEVDAADLVPSLAGVEGKVIVLNDNNALTPQPDFSNPAWVTSDKIAADLGVLIDEPFHATFGAGLALWQMDRPLPPGLYELYVLDTLYSSAGTLDFQVRLGERPLQPLAGVSRVQYRSTRSEPVQVDNLWHSIGMYYVDSPDILSIFTQWDTRDERTVVAVDRVLIVPLPETDLVLLKALPADRVKYFLDDVAARIEGVEYQVPRTDRVAWGNSFQIIANPDQDVRVSWEMQDAVPVGVYEVAVWVPEMQGNATVTYKALANGNELIRTDGTTVITSPQGKYPGGSWVLLGAWELPLLYAPGAPISLVMEIAANTAGEAAVDAVVFMRLPESETSTSGN